MYNERVQKHNANRDELQKCLDVLTEYIYDETAVKDKAALIDEIKYIRPSKEELTLEIKYR